jgi:hypothetical protein
MVAGAGFGNKGTHDWQPHITLLSALSPPLPGDCLAPYGPRIMSLGVLKVADTLTSFSTHTSSADPHGVNRLPLEEE